ncbi:hypothetical protein [Flavihumibacter petaseus]|uniref:DoxX family protein n=1 Tax=Flavihumibacter petaseus NBRC 106054 TaxID=1220578 RepID=A0A0E9MYL3_9BACT|nr:hypothetical protein [Flavihumibacter petaseus]GAO42496.1 hypothetical protein FPE01S_01_15100 [Flavihumibacter petaseus NBRC 106054]
MSILNIDIALPPEKEITRHQAGKWTETHKFLVRILFLITLLFVVPLEGRWYTQFFNSRGFFWYLSSLAGYRPNFIQVTSESGRWGIGAYASWAIAAGIALGGASIWTLLGRRFDRINYDALYYWTQVLIRYRIAAGLIAFGFLKVYPMQMPYPPLSNLLTDFGDYNTYKIYWQHVGISTWYEIVLGFVEVIGGILMFFRGTTALGAIINAGVLFNIAHANLAYDGGVHVYSSFFVLFSLLLLVPYIIRLWKLFVKGEDLKALQYAPVLNTPLKKYLFYGTKFVVVFLFTVLYAWGRYKVHYQEGYLKEPINPALPGIAGIYNVTSFKLNGTELPYNPSDSIRWQEVIFEKWGTMVYHVNKPFPISLANGTPNPSNVDRRYELAGIGGGRRFLYYEADTAKHLLHFQDKNKKGGEEGESRNNSKKKEKPQILTWRYSRPDDTHFVLDGLNEHKDSIHVELERISRDFPIQTPSNQ